MYLISYKHPEISELKTCSPVGKKMHLFL